MSKHHPDLIMCRRQPGIGERSAARHNVRVYSLAFPRQPSDAFAKNVMASGTLISLHALSLLFTNVDLVLSPVCDSYVRPETLVRICDECNFGTYGGRCIICGSPGISDAYYCAECTRLEKDRDGCPKIVNLGASRTDLFYERRRLGFKKG
ncbi:hypothetical protein EVG20_g713 [Dentipellis fragilis]|uniref:Pre-mRNA-splicing factor ini1 n=1 Tax=Dentipellis fragilis TaxID=205917 RepID=A0A4Y9ZFR4_9AGAM|nr:hypothetical protein EVG20_g713 [Dentipellis fragilis]